MSELGRILTVDECTWLNEHGWMIGWDGDDCEPQLNHIVFSSGGRDIVCLCGGTRLWFGGHVWNHPRADGSFVEDDRRLKCAVCLERFDLTRAGEMFVPSLDEIRARIKRYPDAPRLTGDESRVLLEAIEERIGRIEELEHEYAVSTERMERLMVQLAGCSAAALGYGDSPTPVTPESYGWSASFQDVMTLRKKYDRVRRIAQLGKVLITALRTTPVFPCSYCNGASEHHEGCVIGEYDRRIEEKGDVNW